MPTPMAIIMVAIAGICMYTGINYISAIGSVRRHRNSTLFGFLCLFAGLYFVLIIYGYKSGNREALLFTSRWAGVLTAVMSLIILWFISEYCRWKPMWFLYSVSLLFIAQIMVGIFRKYGILWKSVDNVVNRLTPWGETIYILSGKVSYWGYIRYSAYVLLILFGITAVIRLITQNNIKRAILLAVPFLLAVIALVNDTLLDAGRISSIYLVSYIFLVFIVIIGHELETIRLRAASNYHTLFDAIDDAITVHDAYSGIILDANKAAEKLFGAMKEQLLTGEFSEKLLPRNVVSDTTIIARKQLPRDIPVLHELCFNRPSDNEKIWIEMALRFENIDGQDVLLAVTRNITSRKKVEYELEKTQRLESLGVLAGGIAHDFNNLLSGIYGYLQIALNTTNEKETKSYLNETVATIDRACGLTQQLLTFAKGGAPVRRPGKLSDFIKRTTRFALSGSSISCEFRISDTIWNANYDKNQIAQVLDNIVINAKQAMNGRGKLIITASNVTFSENNEFSLNPGKYIAVSIRDTGPGINETILNRIFDPFFTTKENGGGLGLATSYSIIRRHGGTIHVVSDKGAVFTLYLPATELPVIENEVTTVVARQLKGKILVMDDETTIRNAVEVMLKLKGFSVVGTSDGDETVSAFRKHGATDEPITAVLLDLTIPGKMGGRDTVKELRTINPDIPVFVYSGYADDPIIAHPQKYGFDGSITKPFIIEDLIRLIHTSKTYENN